LLFLGAVTAAQAQVYPVQGRWGQSASSEKGAIDCSIRRGEIPAVQIAAVRSAAQDE